MKAIFHDFVEDEEGNKTEITTEGQVAVAVNLMPSGIRFGFEGSDDGTKEYRYRLQNVDSKGAHYIYAGATNRAGYPMPSPRRIIREGDRQ